MIYCWSWFIVVKIFWRLIIDYFLKYVDFQNKRVMQHTAGEKRMSAHPDHSYLRYRRSASQKINIFDILMMMSLLLICWDKCSGEKFMTIKNISVNIFQFLIFCVSDKHEIADMGWSPADTRIIVRLPWPLLIRKWCGELLTIIVNNSNQRFPATAALIIRGKLDNSN